MSSKSEIFLNKALGEDFLESLSKTELWKPGTKSVVDTEDLRIGLKIVPRTILAFLVRELVPMSIGENKSVPIPVDGNAVLMVTKHERDQFSGDILQDNKKIVDFKLRSLPGLGLVIMSAFELYNINELAGEPKIEESMELKVQKLIDERMALHDVVGKAIDKRLLAKEHEYKEKDKIHQMVLAKLSEAMEIARKDAQAIKDVREMQEKTTPQDNEYFRGMTNGLEVANSIVNKKEPKFVEAPKKKNRPLQEFLQKKQNKKEFAVQLAKGEEVQCPDCRKNIFDGKVFSGCICLGQDMEKKVFFKKSEDGIKVRFSRGWDPENIEMLLDVLRNRK